MAYLPDPIPSVSFQSTFTQVVTILAGTDTAVTSISTVTASFYDPGVNISYSSSTVTLSGMYRSIMPITWYWKDLNDQLQSGSAVPAAGTFEKIIQVDSPPVQSVDCIYTVISDAGTETFAHTVEVDYSKIKSILTATLALQPTPPIP